MSGEAKWMEQYQRMQRSYARFATLDHGRPHDMSSDNYDDEVYGFFLNCYHLKDWIKNDAGADPAAQKNVEAFINSSRPLTLCADICNAHKHLKLKMPRSNENPRFTKQHYGLHVGVSPTTLSVKYEIETSAGTLDAFSLATQCINEWDSFINSCGAPGAA